VPALAHGARCLAGACHTGPGVHDVGRLLKMLHGLWPRGRAARRSPLAAQRAAAFLPPAPAAATFPVVASAAVAAARALAAAALAALAFSVGPRAAARWAPAPASPEPASGALGVAVLAAVRWPRWCACPRAEAWGPAASELGWPP
jgi:hypothetical protein